MGFGRIIAPGGSKVRNRLLTTYQQDFDDERDRLSVNRLDFRRFSQEKKEKLPPFE